MELKPHLKTWSDVENNLLNEKNVGLCSINHNVGHVIVAKQIFIHWGNGLTADLIVFSQVS